MARINCFPIVAMSCRTLSPELSLRGKEKERVGNTEEMAGGGDKRREKMIQRRRGYLEANTG